MNCIKNIAETVENSDLTYSEKIKFLKLNRCKLLEEIHKKQQLLDQIDYLILKIKEENMK